MLIFKKNIPETEPGYLPNMAIMLKPEFPSKKTFFKCPL